VVRYQGASDIVNKTFLYRLYGIIRTVNRWVSRFRLGQLAATKASKPWKKINPQDLIQAVKTNPEYKQSDFAKIFKTSTAAICLAFKALGITRKKTNLYREQDEAKR
jgi:transposase